jgi:hypothetical protein
MSREALLKCSQRRFFQPHRKLRSVIYSVATQEHELFSFKKDLKDALALTNRGGAATTSQRAAVLEAQVAVFHKEYRLTLKSTLSL